MTPSLHQSLLMVTDLDASTAFYEGVLGLEPDHVGDAWSSRRDERRSS